VRLQAGLVFSTPWKGNETGAEGSLFPGLMLGKPCLRRRRTKKERGDKTWSHKSERGMAPLPTTINRLNQRLALKKGGPVLLLRTRRQRLRKGKYKWPGKSGFYEISLKDLRSLAEREGEAPWRSRTECRAVGSRRKAKQVDQTKNKGEYGEKIRSCRRDLIRPAFPARSKNTRRSQTRRE